MNTNDLPDLITFQGVPEVMVPISYHGMERSNAENNDPTVDECMEAWGMSPRADCPT